MVNKNQKGMKLFCDSNSTKATKNCKFQKLNRAMPILMISREKTKLSYNINELSSPVRFGSALLLQSFASPLCSFSLRSVNGALFFFFFFFKIRKKNCWIFFFLFLRKQNEAKPKSDVSCLTLNSRFFPFKLSTWQSLIGL